MEESNSILKEILKSAQKIKYGEVVITIHDSKIVQIERREKTRLDLTPTIKTEEKI